MKRNLDLIRDILIFIEDGNFDFLSSDDMNFPKIEHDELTSHLELMADAGFITFIDNSVFERKIYAKIKMRYKGYDYLETIRDSTVWNKTKESIKKVSGGVTFDLIKETAISIIKSLLIV